MEVDEGDSFYPALLRPQGTHFLNQGGVIDIKCFLQVDDDGDIVYQFYQVVGSGASFHVSELAVI